MKKTTLLLFTLLFVSSIWAQQTAKSSKGKLQIPLPTSWTSTSAIGEIHIFGNEIIDKTPPVITFNHGTNLTVSKNIFTITGQAKDVNGVQVVLVHRNSVFTDFDLNHVTKLAKFSLAVTLKEGVNKISVQATDKNGNPENEIVTITYVPGRKDYALLFYVSKYSQNGVPNLSGTKKNAEALGKVLKNEYGFETHTYANLTRNEIREVLRDYKKKEFAPNDQLLIYFSGHGSDIDEGLLLCGGGTDISHSDFSNLSVNKCKHTLLVLDACYSGLLAYQIGSDPGDYIPTKEEYIKEQLKEVPARRVFTSGEGVGTIKNNGLSIFTEALIKVLTTKEGKYHNILTNDELHGFLKLEYGNLTTGYFDESDNFKAKFLFIKK